MKCDFCSELDARWQYPARSFGGMPGTVSDVAGRHRQARERCRKFIEKDCYPELAERVWTGFFRAGTIGTCLRPTSRRRSGVRSACSCWVRRSCFSWQFQDNLVGPAKTNGGRMNDEDLRYLADEKRIRDLEEAVASARADCGMQGLIALALCEIARQLVRLNREETGAKED